MIDLVNVSVYGFEEAIRGMRNPYNSWKLSDTKDGAIGSNDLELMLKLSRLGPDHSKFRRMIHVYMDILAPLYWWKEFDTYKVGTVANSTSTMHSIHKREITIEDFSIETLTPEQVASFKSYLKEINDARDLYLKTKDKKVWYSIIQMLPSSYNQLRTVDVSYEVLHRMHHSREKHPLIEWRIFCMEIEKFPCSDVIMEGI